VFIEAPRRIQHVGARRRRRQRFDESGGQMPPWLARRQDDRFQRRLGRLLGGKRGPLEIVIVE
jgi:hypothetical protein